MSLLEREQDTICAIATPVGPGGIGIIRVSGPRALHILKTLFRYVRARHTVHLLEDTPRSTGFPPGKIKGLDHFSSHHMYYGHIIDPVNQDEMVDECMVVFMKSPKSYTREDVVEIQSHSGYAVLKRILDLVISQGARLAHPGEFTKRAFLNGRIDLAQAEALVELIGAQTETERRIAVQGLLGQRDTIFHDMKDALLNALAHIEVALDFPDEDVDVMDAGNIVKDLKDRVLQRINHLIRLYHEGRIFREGARVVFAGRPNVGKSSIFNAILGMGRVIVSPVPGTTRDTIEEAVDIQGIRVILVDTAGIRKVETPYGIKEKRSSKGETTNLRMKDDVGALHAVSCECRGMDEVEAQGIELSLSELNRATLVLVVLDLSSGIEAEDLKLFSRIPGGSPFIVIFNKSDSLKDPEAAVAEAMDGPLARARRFNDHSGVVVVSARTGYGMDRLKRAIFQAITRERSLDAIGEQGFIPNLRQKECLERAYGSLKSAIRGLELGRPAEIIAMDIRDALKAVNAITGTDMDGDLLDTIFSRFCLGK